MNHPCSNEARDQSRIMHLSKQAQMLGEAEFEEYVLTLEENDRKVIKSMRRAYDYPYQVLCR